MKLINADELKSKFLEIGCMDGTPCYGAEIIDRMSPVKAIPIPDNTTNGDMIRVVYGIEPIYGDEYFIFYGGEMRFSREWWNAPYKGGE